MKITIDKTLQRGLAAQKEGKIQDAVRLYKAVLQSQPKHPDANHNLGVIAVSVNKADAALPLFKTALTANPKKEQFWFSYIDALIKERKLEAARKVIEQVKKKGMAAEKLTAFEKQLLSPNQVSESQSAPQRKNPTFTTKQKKIAEAKKDKKKKKNPNVGNSPSDAEVNELLLAYQNKKFNEAEELAISLTERFPKHPFSWKILGALFGQSGRPSEAVKASQTAAVLSPQDAEAHSNLGVTLKELGRLDEAVASYKQAIALKPDFADAHNNLGNTLKELGRLDEAVASYKQAIALKPDYAEAHYNLGNTLKEFGRLDEAVASYSQAIALKPDYTQAHSNLGVTLNELGRLDEAEASYKQAIALKPDFADAHNNLGNTLKELGRLDEAVASYKQAIALKPDYTEAHYNLGIVWFGSKRYNLAAEQFELCDTHQSKGFAIQCSYLQDEETVFYEKFDLLVSQGEVNAVLGSLGIRSEFRYGVKKHNPFCNDPLKYFVKTDLNELYDFENVFIKTARDALKDNSVSYKAQGYLTSGVQTAGNIFVQGKVPETEIESIIRAEIEKYRIQFKDSAEGFIKNWPTSYGIKGWLVCMQSGGKLAPHMHDTGWITGSIYINIPPKLKTDSGNLVLCLSDQEHVLGVKKAHQSIIDVVTGSLCFFPSSLHHYTIPFENKEERIVLAFDVIPKN